MAHRVLSAEAYARSLVYTRRQPLAGEIFFKYGYDKVFWVAPSLEYRRVLVYPRNQNTSVFGIPSGHKDRSK